MAWWVCQRNCLMLHLKAYLKTEAVKQWDVIIKVALVTGLTLIKIIVFHLRVLLCVCTALSYL